MAVTKSEIRKSVYFDSVVLMELQASLRHLSGINAGSGPLLCRDQAARDPANRDAAGIEYSLCRE